MRYLHLNPVRAGLSPTADRYRWSSHHLYLRGRNGEGVAVEAVLGQFAASRAAAVAAYRAFVQAGLPAGHRDDLYEVVAQRFLGDDRFVERMEGEARHVASKPPVDVSIEVITRHVARVFGVKEIHLRGHGRSRSSALARAVSAYLAREEAGLPVKGVARYFGRDEATLSLAVLRLENRLAADPQFSARVTQLRRILRRGARRRRIKQIIKA